jgi:hypothetical protein
VTTHRVHLVGMAALLFACRREPPDRGRPSVEASGSARQVSSIPPATSAGDASGALRPLRIGGAAQPDLSWRATFAGSRKFAATHALGVLEVAWLPDEVHAISSGVDETTRIWDARTGEVVRQWSGPNYKFNHVVFASDGVHALSSLTDHPIYWNVVSGDVLRELVGAETEGTTAITLSRDGLRAATGSPGHLFVWDLDKGEALVDRPVRGTVLSIAFSEDERQVHFVTDSHSCQVAAQGASNIDCAELSDVQGPIEGASQPGPEVLLGNRTGELYLWDRAAAKGIGHWRIQRPELAVFGIVFRQAAHRAIWAGDTTVRLWDALRRRVVAELPHLPEVASAVALSGDGQLVLVGSEGGSVYLWKPAAR